MDNRVIDILKMVILEYGDRILTDSKRCRALLQDHCCGNYAREVKLLLLALEEGISTELRTPPAGLPATLHSARLVDRLITERFLDQTAAAWTVRAWGDALGVLLPTVADKPLPSKAPSLVPCVTTRSAEQRDIPHTPASLLTASLNIELIPIPAGGFLYGKSKEWKRLPAYRIMKYPVTVVQYRQFCKATGRSMPSTPPWGWKDTHPVVNVTWHDAVAFAAWSSLTLPTEVEWEKAARGTDGREFPWGNDWNASKCSNGASKTSAVGHYPAGASPYGVQDMAGNVWEWCDGWYDNNSRVLRGGSWDSFYSTHFHTTFRGDSKPTWERLYYGFRCVLRSPGP